MQDFKSFAGAVDIRTAASLIRFYLHCMNPEKLEDSVFIDSTVDIWFNRRMEYLASKKEER